MGTHSINVHGTIVKNRLTSKGVFIASEQYKKASLSKENHYLNNHGNDQEMPSINDVENEIKQQEGCRVYGYFYVNKVPGNFHISAHAYGSIIKQLVDMGYYNFDVSHTINSLSFGDKVDLYKIKKEFSEGNLNQLDGFEKIEDTRNVYEYYLKVN